MNKNIETTLRSSFWIKNSDPYCNSYHKRYSFVANTITYSSNFTYFFTYAFIEL